MNAALATEKPPPTNAVSGKMKIRDARETDLPAIIKIYNAAIATRISTAQLEPVTLQERHDWLKDHSPNRHPCWVLEINHNVVGWLNAEIISAAPVPIATPPKSVSTSTKDSGDAELVAHNLPKHSTGHRHSASTPWLD
jgi:phosphinothricin acetyltransferase